MAVLDAIFSRIQNKASSHRKSVWAEYREQILLPLARDQEVDSELLQQFMQALQYDEKQVRRDVQSLKDRFALVEQLQAARELEVQRDKLLEQFAAFDAERDEWLQDFDARVTPVREVYKQVEFQLLGGDSRSLTDRMRSTVVDPHHKQRLQEIQEQLAKLGQEKVAIEQSPQVSNANKSQSILERAKRVIELFSHRSDYDAANQTLSAQQTVAEYEPAMDQLTKSQAYKQAMLRLREISSEVGKLTAERDQLDAKALLP